MSEIIIKNFQKVFTIESDFINLQEKKRKWDVGNQNKKRRNKGKDEGLDERKQ